MLKTLLTQVFLQVSPEKSSLPRLWLAEGAGIHNFLGTFHKMGSWILMVGGFLQCWCLASMKGSLVVGNLWKGEKEEDFLRLVERKWLQRKGVSGLAANTV